jgi:ferrous iron transport protein B
LGLIFFVGMMCFVFQSVYAWAEPFMNLIDSAFALIQNLISPLLEGTPMLQSLVVDGIIAGVGGIVVFLPQIFILFFFIGLLEDTGYMARAAFIMDKLLGWAGLNGKSFIPLLSSYACAVPGIMAARTLEDPKARITTIMIAPLMSCSARLPVYVLFIGAFITPVYGTAVGGFVLFAMHFVGLIIAAPVAIFINRFVLKAKVQPFIIEMSEYRVPRVQDLLLRMWLKGREFIINAGTVIFAFSVIIWALLYFPHSDDVRVATKGQFVEMQSQELGMQVAEVIKVMDEEPDSKLAMRFDQTLESVYLEQSYLARFGKAVQPVFELAGFDWKITVGVLASFPAREVIVSTLGIIYNLGGDIDEESDGLRERIQNSKWPEGTARAGQHVFTIPVAVSIMVFFALCMQCGATVATINRELNWRWAMAAFLGATTMAWVFAVACYQVGMLLYA